MVARRVFIPNRAGVHARAAALIVKEAQKFSAKILLEKDGCEVNARSIMEVLTLAANQGAMVTVRAEGDDERAAVEAIVRLVTTGFGEDR
jgi:phosphocarrier protein